MVFNTRAGRQVRKDCRRLFWMAPVLGLALGGAGAAQAEVGAPSQAHPAGETPAPPDVQRQWTLTFSPIVYHWKYDPDHKPAFIFALERRGAAHRFYGLSLFRNSFGQPSTFAYVGLRWDHLWGQPQLSAKLAAGVIYGYTGQYEDKVPFHWNGFFPGVAPSLVYQFRPQDSLDLVVLGTAAVAFAYSHNF